MVFNDGFSRRVIDFHRRAKPFELNFFLRKKLSFELDGQNHTHSR